MESIDRELLAELVAESRENLTAIEPVLLRMEEDPGSVTTDEINRVFRAIHTIKGGFGFFPLERLKHLSHSMENLLVQLREGVKRLNGPIVSVLLSGVDRLRLMLEDAENSDTVDADDLVTRLRQLHAAEATLEDDPVLDSEGAEEPGPPAEPLVAGAAVPSGATAKSRDDNSVRVDVDRIDRLVDLVGELVTVQSSISQLSEAEDLSIPRMEAALLDLDRHLKDLQSRVMAVRMVPIGHLFRRYPKVVGEMSANLGKSVRLELVGEETELDKGMVERLADPLIHLIRNSLDHGLESPEERRAAGKPDQGVIRLAATTESGQVVIEVGDDGRGLNVDRIRAKAIENGVIRPSEDLSADQIHLLIFAPGFSTAQQVTDISGRGVGMDVVRRNVEDMSGAITIQSRPGQGTTFRIQLPLTMAILDGLALAVGDQSYMIPLVSVLEVVRPAAEEIRTILGEGEVLMLRGMPVPLLRLGRRFPSSGTREPAAATSGARDGLAIIVQAKHGPQALMVDALLGQEPMVIKSLRADFKETSGFLGATINGEGRVSLILDVAGLAR